MSTFSFAPANVGFGDAKKSETTACAPVTGPNALTDYVFVDEHNRHKRLKGRLVISSHGMELTRTSHESL